MEGWQAVYFAAWQGEIYDERDAGTTAGYRGKWPQELGGQRVAAVAGWGGLIIYQAGVPLVSLLRTYFEALLGYLCGRCVPCKSGNHNIARILARLEASRGRPADLEQLERLSRMVTEGSMCALGQFANRRAPGHGHSSLPAAARSAAATVGRIAAGSLCPPLERARGDGCVLGASEARERSSGAGLRSGAVEAPGHTRGRSRVSRSISGIGVPGPG
ncbi:MAG: hypothetical protein D9V47_03700 [Clostridia bacterium]|nr:MAG: hypothetical protein D9V47_03700 [Clostridia bacterium]